MSDINLGPFRINPRGDFNPTTQYRLLDLVNYNGSSYLCVNSDVIDQVANIRELPIDENNNGSKYFMCIAEKGEEGKIAPYYDSFLELSDTNWDYSLSDKIYIPETVNTNKRLNITNLYDGCCGLIVTAKQLLLPTNSYQSVDFNYITLDKGQFYVYSFVCRKSDARYILIWNRTVYINAR